MTKEIVKTTTFVEDIATIKDITTKAFLVTGDILQHIYDDEKYKEVGYNTFAEAVDVELGMKQSNAYELMTASDTFKALSGAPENFPENRLPTAVSQLRPIAKLLPEQQVEVWQEVAKDKVPTAKEVQEYVKEKFPKKKKTTPKKPVVDIPIVDNTTKVEDNTTTSCTNCFALETEIAVKDLRIAELERLLNDATDELMKHVTEAPPQNVTKPEVVSEGRAIPREQAFDIIKERGNNNQVACITKTNPSNEQMYNIICVIVGKLLETTPPHLLPEELRNITSVI